MFYPKEMIMKKCPYYHRSLLCGAPGIAPDLVASTNDAGMEDRTHNSNTCSQLDLVPNHNGIHSYAQGILPTDWRTV